jgi:hemimethylated DNA binding protein
MKPLHHGICKRILAHKQFYNSSLLPFFETLHPCTLNWIMASSPSLPPNLLAGSKFKSLQGAIRSGSAAGDAASPIGLEAIRWIEHLQRRLDLTQHKSLNKVNYDFNVGDIVAHTQLGHVGVVAAQLPVCFESDDWVAANLGSTTDVRLQHPWYLILVARHDGIPVDFTRYGSQLSHTKLADSGSIGLHRYLPMYFEGFDPVKNVYRPRPLLNESAAAPIRKDAEAPVVPFRPQHVSIVTKNDVEEVTA